MDRHYADLPDGMDSAEIEPYFHELLEVAESPTTCDVAMVAEAFYELADRQWHAYEPLAPSVLERVDDWVVRNWDSSSLAFVDPIIGVIAHLGLPRSWKTLKLSIESDLAPDVRAVIERAMTEFKRGDPLDPWSGMREAD